MSKFSLTQDDIERMVVECINAVNETKKIKPWKGNPRQIDPDWAEIRKQDDEFNKGLDKGVRKVNTPKLYRKFNDGTIEKAKIDSFQKKLSKKIQDKAKDDKMEPIERISSTLDTFTPDRIRQALRELGMVVELKGKTFGFGNKKLPPSTLIINVTSSFACPIKDCPLAKEICYAKKTGTRYTNVEKRDMRNMLAYQYLSVKDLLNLVEMYIENTPAKIHDIRLNEAGDFETQEQVDLADKLAGHIKAKYGIKTTVYTRAKMLDFTKVENMIINASSYNIKGADRYFLARNASFMKKIPDSKEITTGIDENGDEFPQFKCCGDCHMCRFCYNTRAENGETGDVLTRVFEKIH